MNFKALYSNEFFQQFTHALYARTVDAFKQEPPYS